MFETIKNWVKEEISSSPKEEIAVSLKELSTIWTKYNTNCEIPRAASMPIMDTGGIVNNPPSQKADPPEKASPSSGTPALPGVLTGSEGETEGPAIVESAEPPPSRPASLNYTWRYTET